MMKLIRSWQDSLSSELLWQFEDAGRKLNLRLDTNTFRDNDSADRAIASLMAQARAAACHGLVIGVAGKPRSRLRTRP